MGFDGILREPGDHIGMIGSNIVLFAEIAAQSRWELWTNSKVCGEMDLPRSNLAISSRRPRSFRSSCGTRLR